MGINRKEFTEDGIKLLKTKEAKNEKKHIPVTFPEPLMDHLLRKRRDASASTT